MERIELIHVNKKLGGKEVLKGVDLTLEERRKLLWNHRRKRKW